MTASLPAPCDCGLAAATRGHDTPHRRWTLVATILASSLAFIDGSVVNVALPAIGRSFSASAADLQWTINAYLLPLSALLLIGGAAGDRFGRRRLLVWGIALFTLASIACAAAPNIAILLTARALQGIGAAMLMPNSLAILGSAFSGEEKGRAIGAWAAIGAIAAAVGPPLGGWLVDVAGWRAVFLVNAPLGAATILIALRYVVESAHGVQPLDWAGAALATLALGLLTWALTLWSKQYLLSPAVLAGLVASLFSLGMFVLVEHRRGEAAMTPLNLFGSSDFVGLAGFTFLLYAVLGGLLVLSPYVLIEAGGYSPLQAGMALSPLPLIIGLTSPTMGRIAARVGPRWPLTIGALVTAVGFAFLAGFDPRASYLTSMLPAVLAIALGMAGAVAPLTAAVLSSTDDRHMGTASGFNSAIARIGGLIATALAGAVIARTGAALVAAFHVAALVGAALALASGALTLATLRGPAPRSSRIDASS